MRIFFSILIALMMSKLVFAAQVEGPAVESGVSPDVRHRCQLEAQAKPAVGDLPLKVLESTVESVLPMFVFISGDGGWNSFDETLCGCLTKQGIPVVVLDARKYFWKSRTPEETATDLITIIETYGHIWKRDTFVLAGFSFGASLVPFLVNRFPAGVLSRQASAILISPDKNCDFEIHLSDMLNLGSSKDKYDVISEIQRCGFKNMEAIFGSDENQDIRQSFLKTGIKVEILQGNHHFDSDSEALADLIVKRLRSQE